MKFKLTTFFIILVFSSCNTEKKSENVTYSNAADWWKEAIIYQIYPRSFKDSDGDGIGDLRGIISELDYIQSLGVTAIWLNPIYSSPNDDNGYDVSNYRDIMSDFGTMEDFDEMLQELHGKNIKLIMDIVVNHSSDEHEWFKQSRSSRENPYRNYYHWWPAEKGKPPYRYSLFDEKGDAWQYDSLTNAYYLHYFSKKQPDLNWSNNEVRREVNDIMKFWAEKGVDGFRLDAFQFAAKDTTFPVFPVGFEKNFVNYYALQDGIHDYLKGMNEEVFSKYNVMSVAEGAGRNFQEAHDLVDEERKELNMAYAFEGVDVAKYGGYQLSDMKEVFSKWDSAFAEKGWLSIFLSNHDQARMVSRWADDSPQFRNQAAKMLNTFILSMRGTPYCYYGDELGMTNIDFQSIDQYKDIAAINSYKKAKADGQNIDEFLKKLNFDSRDNGRTPMQWNTNKNAGFTTGTPWLPVNDNYTEINVKQQYSDGNSVLNHFRSMVKLRKDYPVLVHGKYELIDKSHPQIYAYSRKDEKNILWVIHNFSKEDASIQIAGLKNNNEVLINNYNDVDKNDEVIKLKAYQSLIIK
jgi:oligo-1,6-glucosidase